VEGIAYLRGAVPHMEDLDAVEAVAGEVPGVREVVDELEVQAA
jgi:osmotically-inducible protein OsmY